MRKGERRRGVDKERKKRGAEMMETVEEGREKNRRRGEERRWRWNFREECGQNSGFPRHFHCCFIWGCQRQRVPKLVLKG